MTRDSVWTRIRIETALAGKITPNHRSPTSLHIECINYYTSINFFRGWTALVGLGLLIVDVTRSHSDTPHSAGLLWSSDRPVAETTHNIRNRQTFIPPTGFEPAIPASQRPQNHAIDRAATGIGFSINCIFFCFLLRP